MLGREPKLPVDIAFGLQDKAEDKRSYSDYISDFQNRIKEAFEKAHKNAEKARDKQKTCCDLKSRAAKLHICDTVIAKILAHDGKHKLLDKWAEEVYIVLDQQNRYTSVQSKKRRWSGRSKNFAQKSFAASRTESYIKLWFSE